MSSAITHQLAAHLGSGWLIEPTIAGLDNLVLPRPHLLMHASSRVLDAIEQSHGAVAGLWPTLPPGFSMAHNLPQEMHNFADAYDILRHPSYVPGRAENDPLLAWTEPPAQTWLRQHAIENAEAGHGHLFVDASLGAAPVARLIPESWHRRTPLQPLTLAEQIPTLATVIDQLGWVMLHLIAHGESHNLLIYIAQQGKWDTHELLRQASHARNIPHSYAEHFSGVWRVRSCSG